MNTTESRTLVARIQQGDAAALDDLLSRHLPGLRAYVRLRCGPMLRARESASDITQSACRDVLANLELFQWNGEAGFKAWLYTAALRKIADRAEHWQAEKRDANREVSIDSRSTAGGGEAQLMDVYRSVCTPSKDAEGREAFERLEAAFDRLSDEQREIIAMSRIAGLSHSEIGERLECTPNNARVRLFRALSALSELLEPA